MKNQTPRGVAALMLILAVSGVLGAQETETVEAAGQAAIVDNDRAAARDKAIEDALRKAIESAVGTMISSETVTENYQLLTDKIYSKASGYVTKYKITGERIEDDVKIVEVKADVSKGAIQNDLDALSILINEAKGRPKLLVMIAEQNIGMDRPNYWWGNNKMVSLEMDVVTNTLMEKMMEKGFTFVDPKGLADRLKVRTPVAVISDQQARQMAQQITEAQVVIVGKALAKDLGETVEGKRWRSASAEIGVHAINTSNGEVIAVATAQAIVPHISAAEAGTKALKKASEKLADDLIEKIAKNFKASAYGVESIRMEVAGVKNNRMLSKLIEVMKDMRGIKTVNQQSLSRGLAVLDLQYAGKANALAVVLEAKDFGGGFKVEVTEVKPNSIKIISNRDFFWLRETSCQSCVRLQLFLRRYGVLALLSPSHKPSEP